MELIQEIKNLFNFDDNNKIFRGLLTMSLILYSSFIANILPKKIALYFDNKIIKLISLCIIAFTSTIDIPLTVIMVIAYISSLQTLYYHSHVNVVSIKDYYDSDKLLALYEQQKKKFKKDDENDDDKDDENDDEDDDEYEDYSDNDSDSDEEYLIKLPDEDLRIAKLSNNFLKDSEFKLDMNENNYLNLEDGENYALL